MEFVYRRNYFYTVLYILVNTSFGLDNAYYLPTNILPEQYNLTIEPQLYDETRQLIGSVIIRLKIINSTDYITLHAKNLNFTKNSVTLHKENIQINIAGVSVDVEQQLLIIKLERELQEDTIYTLSFNKFTRYLQYDNYGLYLAKYIAAGGIERVLAVTDFEPFGARSAFPCFDEPQFKASFIVNVIRPHDYISLSNEDLLRSKNLGMNRFQDTFKETVPMSTYLLAIVICDFGQISLERHKIYSDPKHIYSGSLTYALEENVKLLKTLEQYLARNYTLNKVGHVLLPNDYFNKVAMENWGLIMYKENPIVIQNTTATVKEMQKCTLLIAHELSHQWFGNLVTFKDWNCLWLAEGFSTYLQYKISALESFTAIAPQK